MDSRTTRGIKFPALSFMTNASRLAPAGLYVINCHSVAHRALDMPRYNLDALFTSQLV